MSNEKKNVQYKLFYIFFLLLNKTERFFFNFINYNLKIYFS